MSAQGNSRRAGAEVEIGHHLCQEPAGPAGGRERPDRRDSPLGLPFAAPAFVRKTLEVHPVRPRECAESIEGWAWPSGAASLAVLGRRGEDWRLRWPVVAPPERPLASRGAVGAGARGIPGATRAAEFAGPRKMAFLAGFFGATGLRWVCGP